MSNGVSIRHEWKPLALVEQTKRIKKYNYWYSFLKGCIIMKLDVYVYIHVIYNTRGSSIVIHCWTTVQDVKKYIMHWILVYNEDTLYAIRREAIPWGLTSIYSYSQLKSRIYHLVKCQGCTVKQDSNVHVSSVFDKLTPPPPPLSFTMSCTFREMGN